SMGPESIVVQSETGQILTGDRIDFGVALKEPMRREIGRELQAIMMAAEAGDGVVTYCDWVRIDDQLYLLRDSVAGELGRYQPGGVTEACQALLSILKMMKDVHCRGQVMGGLSRGQLRVAEDGRFVVADPRIWNYLGRWLADESYRVCPTPEVIRGRTWTPQTDIFSWGVVAYELLTGRSPYNAVKPEDRTAQILRGKVAPARDYQPQLSRELDLLISSTLAVEPERRPSLDQLMAKLSQWVADGSCEAPAAETAQYAMAAARNRRRHQSRERAWLWFRRHGTVTLAILAVVVVGYFLMTGFRAEPVVTRETPPLEVVRYYFDGIRRVNVPLVSETLHRAKNSLEDVVANIHVLNMQGLAYNTGKEGLKLIVDNLGIELLTETETEVRYQVSYVFRIVMPEKEQVMQRVDEFTLRPVKKVWKITDIKVLREERTGD
ncbi:protein kinase domain-containing protein, partial [Mycobacterium tuberculosis]|uniref:protein kinase domain-containing protein n=1 Tax=Mycobacterium tuberculosis TaxID=1773 RepID=UPI000B24BDC5